MLDFIEQNALSLYKPEEETLSNETFVVRTNTSEKDNDAPDEHTSCRSLSCVGAKGVINIDQKTVNVKQRYLPDGRVCRSRAIGKTETM